MQFYSEIRPIIDIEDPHDEILTLPIIIEDGEIEMESDFEDVQPIFIIVPPSASPGRERNQIEIEIRYEPANVEYVEVELALDANDSMTNDSKEVDIDDDDFGELLSDSKQSTKVPVEYLATDDSDSMPENENDVHTDVNTDEAESSNSRYYTTYDYTV